MSLYEESNQFRAELEQQVENVDIREITQLPNFKNWFNSKKAHSKCYDYDLPKLFYRTLNSIDNLDNIVNGNEQSRFVGEYFTDDLDTALTYVEHLENSKILIGFLNIQNPAIIDCNGAGWNEIRQNATVTEQLAYFEYLGFNEKPDNFEENRAYPIDLRNNEKDEGISFFLQIKTINKDTTPSFIKITAPQYYQNDRSFRKTKFINLDMLGYGTPSLFNDIGTTNFWATNLAHRHRFDSVIFENLNDDGGRGVTLFEKSVKKRQMHGTVVCAFDRENSYFKHANNHGDFNPDDRRIFYSLFDIEQDFKQEKTEKDKTMENQTMQQTQATQQTAENGGFYSPKNYENTVNYDLRGLSEFSGSVAAYFNNSQRQELVLAFKKTLERSFDLRHQHFIGIHPKQSVQFERIAAFSPLELSAILDCKPEFANNMREYIVVVEDFERNNQQQQEAHKKAADALRISPAYQEMNDKHKNWARINLYSEYIDGGEKFARAKTGEITNGDRLKQVIANAIDAIAPAVKYSLSQQDFWQERDDLSFIVQPQIRNLLRQEMGFPAELVEVKTRHQIWYEDRAVFDTLSNNTSGFFTPKNGKTVIVADAFIKRPELAVFTAYHELGHRGIELQGRELWNEWLEKARQNPTVRAIADHAQVHYAAKGNILSDIAATEEALVEVFAAYKTQKWDYLAERHNVEIPQEFKKPQGTAEKLWQSAKNKIGQIFGRQSETVSDAAVFAMLGKLEQSLYQFPEWKQKLEKTVRVGQHNPFVVAKQPIISGSLRVNPTALTNRYRSGGLRFDLNTQDNSDFAKAVDDIAKTGKTKGTFFHLGTTPDAWKLVGIDDRPVDIYSDCMIKSMGEYLNLPPQYYRDGREKGRHNLSPETLKQIPEQLNDPVAVFKSADTSSNPKGYVVLTELIEHDRKTGEEKPVIAALHLREVKSKSLEIIDIKSVYGRWDWQIEKAVEHIDKQGNKVSDLLYWHTTKGHQLANSFGLRLPTWLSSLDDLSNRNIKTEKDLLQYQKDKEMEKNQQQGTTTPEISENTVKFDAFSQSEKENTMNETEKQALAQAFKNLELPDRKYVVKGSLVEFQDRPESEIIAALAWDEFATAVKDYVNSQSDENAEKLSNAYLAYPFYNELANKGIRDDSSLRNRYAKVIESEFSSFHEKRTAALFILQSMWRGRGNSTDITRSYNIDAMTAYIARGRELRSGWRLENRVNEYFLTKNSIFTHKNLREMGLDNNPNLAPYAPELLQEMVKIEVQYREFSQWQNQNSEGGWYNRGAENIIDFKQIPAAVQKDLILMVSDRYLSKRDIFGVYDNPVISMQYGLAVRSEVQHNLEMLIGQQEKELQQYQKMGLGVPVPQEDAITQQINAYKETLEQVKNAPAVAFVPETLFVRGETKPDWRTGEVQRYNTTEINTATGEITFVNDKNNPNPNPFGDMTEQARQYLSANNNFALAALGVAPKEMPENVKFDDFGTTETEPRLGYDAITLSSGEIFLPVISNFADTQLKNADFKTVTNSLGERRPIDGDDYAKFENHQSQANFFYCVNTQEFVLFVENPSKEHFLYNVDNRAFYRFDEIDIQSQIENRLSEKQQGITASATLTIEQQRIEKREQIFDMLWAARSMENVYFDTTPPDAKEIWAKYGNMIGRFDEKTGDLSFRDYNGGGAVFVINTDKISARTAAVAFMRGIDEYVKQYKYGVMQVDLTPKRRRDIQERVNFVIAENRRIDDPTNFSQRREFMAKRKEQYAERETQKQTALQGGVSSPENSVKFDDFGVSETENTVKHDLNTLPETLTPQEQALKDGKALSAADEKVGDAKWELDKQPNNPERQAAYQQAITERQALHNEVKQRVSDAMDKGEPYVIRYDEVPTAPFNGEKAPIELVVTQNGNLRLAIGTLDKPHNLTAVDSTPELALNTEQRSSPKRTAEVLRERFNLPIAAIADRLACINYPNADKVFSEQEIKDALNKALKSSSTRHQLAALHSPQMKDEWLQAVIDKYPDPQLVENAKTVLSERQKTAAISGFSFDDDTPQAKQSPQSQQAAAKDDELLKQLCKPDFALRKAALNDPEISVNLLKRVIDSHKCPQTRNVAKAVLGQRQGGGVGVSQPQSNTRSIAGATPKAAAPTPQASMSV